MTEEDDSVDRVFTRLRRSFDSGRLRTKHARLRNLRALRQVLVEGRPLLIEALGKDLHKSSTESYYTEMNLVEHEIQHMIDHLGSYMSPTSVVRTRTYTSVERSLPSCVVLVV